MSAHRYLNIETLFGLRYVRELPFGGNDHVENIIREKMVTGKGVRKTKYPQLTKQCSTQSFLSIITILVTTRRYNFLLCWQVNKCMRTIFRTLNEIFLFTNYKHYYLPTLSASAIRKEVNIYLPRPQRKGTFKQEESLALPIFPIEATPFNFCTLVWPSKAN